jgi:hypothetical protein
MHSVVLFSFLLLLCYLNAHVGAAPSVGSMLHLHVFFFEVVDLVRLLVNGLNVFSEISTNTFQSTTASSHCLGDLGLIKGDNVFKVVLLPPSTKLLFIRSKASQSAASWIVIS